MGNDPIFLTNLNLAYVVGRKDRSPCQRTQRWNTSKVCLLAVLITTLSCVVEENTKSSWARSRAQLQALMIFYTPAPVQPSSISLDACAMLCWGHNYRPWWFLWPFLGSGNWFGPPRKIRKKTQQCPVFDTLFGSNLTSFEAPEATKLTAFEAPHARIDIGCVRGCYLKQNLSRKDPKKEPKCDYFFGFFFEASPKPLLWVCDVKMGSWKVPKIDHVGTPSTLLKCGK